MTIEIISRGDSWVAVEKPAGMSVHNDPGRDLVTLMAKRLVPEAPCRSISAERQGSGVFAVHRLDKETSGVVLLALDRDSAGFLARQFQQRQVAKRYIALVHGEVKPLSDRRAWAIWRHPLTQKAGGRQNPAGRGPRVDCETGYRVIRSSTHYTLVSCAPKTGRKHQIRRHAKLAGHPVVGDNRYGSPRSLKYLREKSEFNRMALHAQSLRFQPAPGADWITVCSHSLPAEIQTLFDADMVG